MPKNHIYKLADGRYRYKATDADGKLIQITSFKTESRPKFVRRCNQLDNTVSRALSPDYTLDWLFSSWIRDKWPNVERDIIRNVDKQTSDYRTTLGVYKNHIQASLGSMELANLKRRHIYDLLMTMRSKGYSDSLIAKARGAISRPLDWGINTLQLNLTNVCAGLRLPRRSSSEGQSISFYTKEDLKRFFTAAELSKWRYYFRMLLYSGLRPSEALGLKWEDVSEAEIKIQRRITAQGLGPLKTAAAYRSIPLSAPIRNTLESQRKLYPAEDWIFAEGVKNLSAAVSAFERTRQATAVWKKVGRKYHGVLLEPALDRTLYDLRHTFGTQMAEQGMPDHVLANIMGHADISVTKKYYIGISDQMINTASAIMSNIIMD